MFNVNRQSLMSCFAYAYTNFKQTMAIGIIISACEFIMQLLILVIMSITDNISSSSNSGMLLVSYGSIQITFLVIMIVNTSNGYMKNMFRFPINRPTYAIGMLLYILITPIFAIAVVSLFQSLESLTYSLMAVADGRFTYLNSLTAITYLDGIIPSYTFMVYAMSFIYMLAMYFHRYKKLFLIVLVIVLMLLIFIGGFRNLLIRVFIYPFTLKKISAFALYTLGASLLLNALAFVPLKAMEVKS